MYTLPPKTTETPSQRTEPTRSIQQEATEAFDEVTDEPTAEAVPEVAPTRRSSAATPTTSEARFLPEGKEEPVEEFKTTTTATELPTTLAADDADLGAFSAGGSDDYYDDYADEPASGESTTLAYHIVCVYTPLLASRS